MKKLLAQAQTELEIALLDIKSFQLLDQKLEEEYEQKKSRYLNSITELERTTKSD